jgi:electron transport complex protein RnfB
MLSAIGVLTLLGLGLGYLLGLAAKKFHVETPPLEAELMDMLPGSNCGQCGFAGCPAAAAALAAGSAPVTLCPPGGRDLVERLAERLGVTAAPGDTEEERLALVREENCIGCIKCARECPTDAIVGAPKQIHTVLREACTGCGKCIDVCPTATIVLAAPPMTLRDWRWSKPAPAFQTGRAAA